MAAELDQSGPSAIDPHHYIMVGSCQRCGGSGKVRVFGDRPRSVVGCIPEVGMRRLAIVGESASSPWWRGRGSQRGDPQLDDAVGCIIQSRILFGDVSQKRSRGSSSSSLRTKFVPRSYHHRNLASGGRREPEFLPVEVFGHGRPSLKTYSALWPSGLTCSEARNVLIRHGLPPSRPAGIARY